MFDFETFVGHRVHLDEVTPALLDKYAQSPGSTNGQRKAKRQALRAIMRAARPEEFRKQIYVDRLCDAPEGTARHFYENNYLPEKLVGVTSFTLCKYEHTFRLLHRHFGRDLTWAQHTSKVAAEHLAWLLDRGVRPLTVNHHRACWFAVWRLAAEYGLIDRDPKVRKLKVEQDAPDAWSEEEVRRIIETSRTMWPGRTLGGVPARKFWPALLLTEFYTALRQRSLFLLTPEDLDLSSGWLTVPAAIMKNRRGQRFRLGEDALAAVREIYDPSAKRLFPFPYQPERLGKQFKRILQAAGITPSRRTKKGPSLLHKFRRTVATLVASRAGIEAASALLGHSGIEVTRRYVDPSKMPGHDVTQILPALYSARIDQTPSSPPSKANVASSPHFPPPDDRSAEAAPDRANTLLAAADVIGAGCWARIAWQRRLLAACPAIRRERHRITLGSQLDIARAHGLLDRLDIAELRVHKRNANQFAHGKDKGPIVAAELIEYVRGFLADCT